MRCAWECLDVTYGRKREGNVAVINYRYDGDKTPPAHLGYQAPDAGLGGWRRDAVTMDSVGGATPSRIFFDTSHMNK